MTVYIDDDRDVIPAVVQRESDAIVDVIALDEWLAAEQERSEGHVSFGDAGRAYQAGIHGTVTDLRVLIGPWVAEARLDAMRVAHEERADV